MSIHYKGENLSGNWRWLSNGGIVEIDWCWRCDQRPAYLAPDPKVGDAIGVCVPCAQRRRRK